MTRHRRKTKTQKFLFAYSIQRDMKGQVELRINYGVPIYCKNKIDRLRKHLRKYLSEVMLVSAARDMKVTRALEQKFLGSRAIRNLLFTGLSGS